MFDRYPRGAVAGWRTFWSMFEQKYVAQDEQSLWIQFESRTQQAGETVETYADALRRMADRLGVPIDSANIRMRFLKGLLNSQVKARVENLSYLLAPTFEDVEAAASHHEKTLRREKSSRTAASHNLTLSEGDKKNVPNNNAGDLVKGKDEGLQKVILELKRELAVQKQQIARMQLERLKQSKPERPCFTCGSTEHCKRTCPLELAKRGKSFSAHHV